MAKKEKEPVSLLELVEKILGTKSVLAVDMDDVGVVIGDRRFSFSGKLKIGPIVLGESKEK